MVRILESSSANERLNAAREFVRTFRAGTELLLIGPSRESIDDFTRELSLDAMATFGLHRFSLTHFAARMAVASLARQRLVPATILGAEATAARSSFEAARRGVLKYFLPVAMRPGFSRALAATISEVRMAGLDASELAGLGEAGSDVSELMKEFQEQLANSRAVDRSQLFEIALQAVEHAAETSLIGKPILMLDVGLHTESERAFAVGLINKASQGFATVPAGDKPTLDCLCNLPAAEHVVAHAKGTHSLARLQNSIFSDSIPSAESDNRVRFFSAPGESRECVEIARFILEEAKAGTPFDRIAVLLRQRHAYSDLLQAALNRAGIPSYFARGTARPDPSGRAFLAILSCATEGLSARRFAEYLSFGQVPKLQETGAPPDDREIWSPSQDETAEPVASPLHLNDDEEQAVGDSDDQPTVRGALRAPRKWEQLLVEAAVIGGKDRWERRLRGLESELRLKLDELRKDEPESPRVSGIERDLNNLAHLERFALPLIEFLSSFPESATWGERLDSLEKLANMALRYPERVLSVITELKPLSAVGPVALDEVRDVLSDRLSSLDIEPPKSRYGCVFVSTPEHVRGRCFEVVFVPGLAERNFPARLREDPVLLDGLRRRLGAQLTTQDDRVSQERLLLRLEIGAATRQMYLSYPRIEVGLARPRVPSFYALDVQRAVTGRVPEINEWERKAARISEASLDWPAPRQPELSIDDVEHDLSILRRLLHSDPATVTGRANYLFTLNRALGRSLRTRWARWRQRKWSGYDGLCSQSEDVRDLLNKYTLRSRSYSPTALQHFAVCPYRFLLAGIYRLAPHEAVSQVERLDPMTKGAIFHNIQAELIRELSRCGFLPLNQTNLEGAGILLDQIVDRVGDEFREKLVPAIDRVWRDEIDHLRADLRSWLRRLAEVPDGWTPILIEYSFGLPTDSSNDPQSIQEPVTLEEGFKIHGVVDLVERKESFLRVTDTKTGSNSANEGTVTGHGEKLQPILYSLAVEAARTATVGEARYSFPTSAGGFTQCIIPIDSHSRHQGLEVLRIIDASITKGFLPPAPREKGCDYCDFRVVCGPYEEIRARRKDQSGLDELSRLRGMA
jgi:superfamily I DNA/RNA helicase/CRISPR/Cas system-associated exonuclease Cas4 (RecB family)